MPQTGRICSSVVHRSPSPLPPVVCASLERSSEGAKPTTLWKFHSVTLEWPWGVQYTNGKYMKNVWAIHGPTVIIYEGWLPPPHLSSLYDRHKKEMGNLYRRLGGNKIIPSTGVHASWRWGLCFVTLSPDLLPSFSSVRSSMESSWEPVFNIYLLNKWMSSPSLEGPRTGCLTTWARMWLRESSRRGMAGLKHLRSLSDLKVYNSRIWQA